MTDTPPEVMRRYRAMLLEFLTTDPVWLTMPDFQMAFPFTETDAWLLFDADAVSQPIYLGKLNMGGRGYRPLPGDVEFVSGRPDWKYILSLYLGCDTDP